MYAEIAVVRGAVKTEVDAEGNGRPGRIFATAVKAYLANFISVNIHLPLSEALPTLFAGFVFNFSKIFSDWDLDARAMVAMGRYGKWRTTIFYNGQRVIVPLREMQHKERK